MKVIGEDTSPYLERKVGKVIVDGGSSGGACSENDANVEHPVGHCHRGGFLCDFKAWDHCPTIDPKRGH